MKGPQVTLYVPGGILYPAPKRNTVVMLELENPPSAGNNKAIDIIRLVKDPIIDGRCFNSTVIERFSHFDSIPMFRQGQSYVHHALYAKNEI